MWLFEGRTFLWRIARISSIQFKLCSFILVFLMLASRQGCLFYIFFLKLKVLQSIVETNIHMKSLSQILLSISSLLCIFPTSWNGWNPASSQWELVSNLWDSALARFEPQTSWVASSDEDHHTTLLPLNLNSWLLKHANFALLK